ncbi:hypothetical protein CPC08DRAFT_669527 [Agrocybe pediades]|nr:hypothetical protein CPC08DRAFT_669527 [Agrocybe pediades]
MSPTPPRTPNQNGHEVPLDYEQGQEGQEHEYEHQLEVESALLAQSTMEPPPQMLTPSSSSGAPLTRTVAIIKPHALDHRFEIERRIQEASFEIVKERQMEFDTESDPDTLYELFGQDADAFAEGPVWVYVLERRRAVEVWNTLMGDRNVEIARRESPNSLRALYGISNQQNGLMGSPDTHTAEIQIASVFASSPPFPSSELPPMDDMVDGALLDSIRGSLKVEDEGYAPSNVTDPSTAAAGGGSGRPKLNANGKAQFKARPVPATHDKPDIVPRTTRAAALRAGQVVEKPTPRAPVSKERLAQTFANVPGHKRSSTIQVASTAAPAIAPRMTRAASLRLGQPVPPPSAMKQRSVSDNGDQVKKDTFEGVPGHKRRESIAVASAKPPSVAPRLNKSAALRAQQKEKEKEQQVAAPPSSFRAGSTPKAATLSRVSSRTSVGSGSKVPSAASVVRPASQASVPAASRYAAPRASSVAAVRLNPTRTTSSSSVSKTRSNGAAAPENETATSGPEKPELKRRPSSIAAPSIAPRTNRSAALRAAKKEAEAAAANVRKAPRPSRVAPPSSFKAIPA